MIDVLIAGAGPTGLTLAMLCRRLGLSYRIIDKNSGPSPESRAIGIQARTMELFEKLGIVDDFLDQGMAAQGAKLHVNGSLKLELDVSDMNRDDTIFPFVFFISQAITEKIFLKEVTDVERHTRLVSFKDKGNRVAAVVLNSEGVREHISARFLCGCDGSHSLVRKLLGLEFKGDSYGSEFLMADCKVNWSAGHDKLQVFLNGGKIGVFFPLKDNRSRVLTISDIPKSSEPKTQATTAYPAKLHELEVEFKKACHLDLSLSEPEWVTRYHIHHRTVDRMRVGNVFLLGDAAHIHSPVGAQGMNTGIQDANNLAWKMKAAITRPGFGDEILETYNTERIRVAKHLINFTDRVFSLAVTPNKVLQAARNMFLPIAGSVLMNVPAGKRLLFRFISQLNIHYHANLINRTNGLRLLEAGERAPNGKISRRLWIHDFFQGYQFHAVVFKKKGFNDLEVSRIYDHMDELGINHVHFFREDETEDSFSVQVPGEIFNAYDVDGEALYIIRPDGYIGYCGNEIMAKPDYLRFDLEDVPVSNFTSSLSSLS